MDVRVIDIHSFDEAVREIRETGADPYSIPLMAEKAYGRVLRLANVDNRAANLLKQEMLSLGGEAAVSRDVSRFRRGTSRALLLATPKQYRLLAAKLARQPFGLKKLAGEIQKALSHAERNEFALSCGGRRLDLGPAPVVMGIVNVTPDSFSDGSSYRSADEAAERALALEAEGAGIIDIGGESTRPGAARVSAAEEIRRVVPVIRALAGKVRCPLSVDTYKPEVARAALDAGATLINDITGLRYRGGAMADLAARSRVPVVIMHMRGTPRTMQKNPRYRDVVDEVGGFLARRAEFAVARGVPQGQIVLDPGIGFGKTIEHNLALLRRLGEFRALGYPIAVGTSRKSFIGALCGGMPPRERLAGSIGSSIWAALSGARIVRAHDVKETVQALCILKAIQGGDR